MNTKLSSEIRIIRLIYYVFAISCSNMILLAVYRFFRSYQSCVISYHGAFKQFRKHDITSLMRMDIDNIIQRELDEFIRTSIIFCNLYLEVF